MKDKPSPINKPRTTSNSRRRFVGSLAGAAAVTSAPLRIEAQAFPKTDIERAAEPRRKLAAALRELNDAAGLGVTPDEIDRAEAYATGAILEAHAKLRPLVLSDDLDLSTVFRAPRKA